MSGLYKMTSPFRNTEKLKKNWRIKHLICLIFAQFKAHYLFFAMK
jgi:hypothetical protein